MKNAADRKVIVLLEETKNLKLFSYGIVAQESLRKRLRHKALPFQTVGFQIAFHNLCFRENLE